jgi:glycosyltransferase involved in cell wall biosynthesis
MGNKHILFDLSSTQPVSTSDFHGGGEYAKTVFYRLCELLTSGTELEVFYNPTKNIEDAILEICKTREFKVNLCRTNTEISKLLCEKKYNIFYSALPYLYCNLVIPEETKFVYTIHGLRSLEYPVDMYELKYKANIKKIFKNVSFLLFLNAFKKHIIKRDIGKLNNLFSVAKNQTIITVSNHSKYSIAYFFPHINISNLKVFYSPLKKGDFDESKDSEILKSFSLESKKYILLISGDRSEKGAYRACRVLYNLIIKHNRFPVDIKVIVTGVSFFNSYRKLVKNNSRFEFRGYVVAEELESLYRNAYLFLYPTLNEGFGYPPLEAMKYGTLCACSANSAVTEVCGDAVLYFNPHDETEMCIRILQSFDEEIRREKTKKITERRLFIGNRQEQDLNLLIKEIT